MLSLSPCFLPLTLLGYHSSAPVQGEVKERKKVQIENYFEFPCVYAQTVIHTVNKIRYLLIFSWWRNLLTSFEKATQNVTENKNAKRWGGLL